MTLDDDGTWINDGGVRRMHNRSKVSNCIEVFQFQRVPSMSRRVMEMLKMTDVWINSFEVVANLMA